MSPLCYILAALTIAFAVSCVMLRRKNRSFEGMLCKFMASFGFISIAIIGYCTRPHNTYYFCIVCFALMFGFCGDVLLGIKEIAPQFKSRLVVLGMVYFLVGHIFYLCAFIHTAGFNIIPLLLGVAGAVFAFVMIKVIKMKADGKMRIIMSVYYGTLIYQRRLRAILLSPSLPPRSSPRSSARCSLCSATPSSPSSTSLPSRGRMCGSRSNSPPTTRRRYFSPCRWR